MEISSGCNTDYLRRIDIGAPKSTNTISLYGTILVHGELHQNWTMSHTTLSRNEVSDQSGSREKSESNLYLFVLQRAWIKNLHSDASFWGVWWCVDEWCPKSNDPHMYSKRCFDSYRNQTIFKLIECSIKCWRCSLRTDRSLIFNWISTKNRIDSFQTPEKMKSTSLSKWEQNKKCAVCGSTLNLP